MKNNITKKEVKLRSWTFSTNSLFAEAIVRAEIAEFCQQVKVVGSNRTEWEGRTIEVDGSTVFCTVVMDQILYEDK